MTTRSTADFMASSRIARGRRVSGRSPESPPRRRVGHDRAARQGPRRDAGCRGDGYGASAAVDSPEARRLDGAWVIEIRVDRLGFEAVSPGVRGVRRVRGEIALVANHWLGGGEDLPRPTHYGTY